MLPHSFSLREHLCDGGLDDPRGVLALLTRLRSRHSEANARPRFSELLPTQPPSPRDQHALRERPIYDVLQKAVLAAISNDGAPREAAVVGFGDFTTAIVNDGVAVRRWRWMIGEAA